MYAGQVEGAFCRCNQLLKGLDPFLQVEGLHRSPQFSTELE